MTVDKYIARDPESLWDWHEQDAYIQFKGGVIIAHWEDLKNIINAIANQGLPLFDVLILLLASFNDKQGAAMVDLIINHYCNDKERMVAEESLSVLKSIQNLPEEYKKGDKRLLALATIIQHSHVTLKVTQSKFIAHVLEIEKSYAHFQDTTIEVNRRPKHRSQIINSLRVLSKHFPDAESIMEAMAVFDSEKIKSIDLAELPDSEAMTQDSDLAIEEQLLSDIRTRKFAKTFPFLLAGMNFPIIAKHAEERPEGGVSDLSNKGHFDQLVVTEYAYDKDQFLSRIANNEALFFQRERANKHNNESVCILVDTTLYNWGVPKFIGYAIACSLGIQDENVEVVSFAVGEKIESYDLKEKSGVVDALKSTSCELSPAQGLFDFIQSEPNYSSTMFISNGDTLKHPEIIKFNEDYPNAFDIISTINEIDKDQANSRLNKAKEEVEVLFYRPKGKLLAKFQLNLDQIWADDSSVIKEPIQINEFNENFPPILVPLMQSDVKHSIVHENVFYFISKANYLIQASWKEVSVFGGKQCTIIKKIEHNVHLMSLIGRNANSQRELLLFDQTVKMIYVHNLDNDLVTSFHFQNWKGRYKGEFVYDSNHFKLVSNKGYVSFNNSFCMGGVFIPDVRSLGKHADFIEKNKKDKNRIPNSVHSFKKRINNCFVSHTGDLIIGGRALRLNVIVQPSYIEFSSLISPSAEVVTKHTKEGLKRKFSFDNGAQIVVNEYGVVSFSFSGNEERFGYEISIKEIGEKRLQAVKAINIHSQMGLKYAKQIADKGSGTVLYTCKEKDALAAKQDLEALGATVDFRMFRVENTFHLVYLSEPQMAFASKQFFSGRKEFKIDQLSNQKTISERDFYQLYLEPFISVFWKK